MTTKKGEKSFELGNFMLRNQIKDKNVQQAIPALIFDAES
jgi:hypothetical protein